MAISTVLLQNKYWSALPLPFVVFFFLIKFFSEDWTPLTKIPGSAPEAAGRTPYTFYKPTLGPKYVSNRPYNEFITLTTFI